MNIANAKEPLPPLPGAGPQTLAGLVPVPSLSAFAWRGSIATMTPDGNSLHLVRLKRRNNALETLAQSDFPLGADLRSDPPEVVAQELRERLRSLGWRDRRWVFAVPPGWLVSHRVSMPDIPLGEQTEYLWLQAEQTLPVAIGHCALAFSRHRLPDHGSGATLFALNDVRLQRLRDVFKATRLHLLAVAPGVIDGAVSEATAAFLTLGATHSVMQVSSGGGVLMLREMPGVVRADAPAAVRMLKQQVCMVLGQAPAAVRQQLDEIKVAAAPEKAGPFVAAWNGSASEPVTGPGQQPLRAVAVSLSHADLAPVFALSGGQVSAFMVREQKRSSSRLISRPLRYAALVGAAAIAAALSAVVYQDFRVRQLQRTAAQIAPQAELVNGIRQQLGELAPWISRNPLTLHILRTVTEAFPERGTVWLTGLRVSENAEVQLSGQATDAEAWMAMLEKLRRSPFIRDLRVSQTRSDTGQSDRKMVFAITFTWHGRQQAR